MFWTRWSARLTRKARRSRMEPMATAFKDQAHKLIDRLPETADWDED
jgi:hypothetical protein